jgi:hypothetical protein
MPSGVIICRRVGPKFCQFCRQRPATKLCDYRIAVGDIGHTRTCDAPMCSACGTPIAHEVDYCPDHAKHAAAAKAEAAA